MKSKFTDEEKFNDLDSLTCGILRWSEIELLDGNKRNGMALWKAGCIVSKIADKYDSTRKQKSKKI